MITKAALLAWVLSLPEGSEVVIDEGGIALLTVGDPTEKDFPYLEVGGLPDEAPDEVQSP